MLDKGYEVFLIDQWSVGRASATDFSKLQPMVESTVELTELAFTAPELYHKYYQAQFHTQWPGVSSRLHMAGVTADSELTCHPRMGPGVI